MAAAFRIALFALFRFGQPVMRLRRYVRDEREHFPELLHVRPFSSSANIFRSGDVGRERCGDQVINRKLLLLGKPFCPNEDVIWNRYLPTHCHTPIIFKNSNGVTGEFQRLLPPQNL